MHSVISSTAYLQSARHGDPHTHTIDNVDLDHEGLYTCVVGNGKLDNWRHRSILILKVGKFPAPAIVTNMSNYIFWILWAVAADLVLLTFVEWMSFRAEWN